jgi:hypothetical protein
MDNMERVDNESSHQIKKMFEMPDSKNGEESCMKKEE